MAPRRSTQKRKETSEGMTLRSRPLQRRQVVLEDGSSRILPLRSPNKRVKKPKRCVFIDDEASVDRSIDGDSNSIQDVNLSSHLEKSTPQSQSVRTLTFEKPEKGIDESKQEKDELSRHSRIFGESVSLGLMNDVMSQFNVTKKTECPLVPLCRLIPTDAVRPAVSEASWLIPLFDRVGYVQTMGSFIVSVIGRHGEERLVTKEMEEKWDPIWQKVNTEFERKLVGEWKDLRGKAFFVWDGNHRVKTWLRRINEGK